MKEKIKIEFFISAEFWNLCPVIEIFVDNVLCYQGTIDQKKTHIAVFSELELEQPHCLSLKRSNKYDSECVIDSNGIKKDQYIIIDHVVIDGIDVENLVLDRSWYEPEYSQSWINDQTSAGVELEYKVPGETWLSHNGVWYFEFSSPFYKFIIDQFKS